MMPGYRAAHPLAAPPDSTAVAPSDSAAIADSARAAEPVIPPPVQRPAVTDTPAVAQQPAVPESAARDTSGAAAGVSILLPASERLRLRAACLKDLAIADSLLAPVAAWAVTAADVEKVATARGFLDQARAALAREDIQAAANLAHKGRLLTEELSSRRPGRRRP
jgi:hypothetical protein